ncbi:hypothetical protein INT44_000995 [Umbelopsis vinacea]|uniref:Uncharacterized protein n=1 Tax=Umbelopsis vinacea TaxID=44442 RepID=A0A8H7UQF1_9FUNG|nr:hypothetical protein INT44_000995 [Umbelopsis vinacea]
MVKTELTSIGIEEGEISHITEPEPMVHATFPDEKKENQVAEQEVSQVSCGDEGEGTKEESSDSEFEDMRRIPSQDSACFTDPICRSCFNDTNSNTESEEEEEEDIVTTDCVHGLKRDWTRIEVILPEVYTSSQESMLDAVVSASTA